MFFQTVIKYADKPRHHGLPGEAPLPFAPQKSNPRAWVLH